MSNKIKASSRHARINLGEFEMLSRIKSAVRSFDRDERGIETIQVIMVVAIAAFIGLAIYKFADGEMMKSMTDAVKDLLKGKG